MVSIIFSYLPNDLIIKILNDRKELKRDDRFKKQFNKVLSDISYYGEKKLTYQKTTILQTMRHMYYKQHGLARPSKAIMTFWDYNQDTDRSPVEFENSDWEIVDNMSKHLARVGIRSQENHLMEMWEDYKDDDFEEEDPFLLCVYKLYPEWGVRYLGQDKPEPWLPCNNGYFK